MNTKNGGMMKTFSNYDFKDVLVFIENKDYQRANDMLMEMHDYAKNFLQQNSAHLLYYIGVCQDYLDNRYTAIKWLNEALKIDPFNYYYAAYRTGVLGEIEKTIESHIPYGADRFKEVEKIYKYLIEQGYVRSSLQFNMIRFYIKVNEIETARTMLENYLTRNPNDEDAKLMYTSLDTFVVGTNPLKQKQKLKCA